jgi:hypothetical protein
MVLDDATIRAAMQPHLTRTGLDRLIISELGIEQGSSRADIAVVDDHALWLYEIKGETDSLKRLPAQVDFYSRVADYAVLVVTSNYVRRAMQLLPEWWGVLEARKGVVPPSTDVVATFTIRRVPRSNPHIDPLSLVQLLWRDETWAALRRLGRGRGLSGANRMALWVALAEAAPLSQLRRIVRDTLRSRDGWLHDGRHLRVDRQ